MRHRGFTLIELLLVTGVLAALFAVSLPVFSALSSSLYLNAAARGLAADLRALQSRAMTRHQTLTLATSSYPLPKKVKCSQPKTISFASSGYPPPGGSGTIILSNNRGATKKIIVSSAGRVRLE